MCVCVSVYVREIERKRERKRERERGGEWGGGISTSKEAIGARGLRSAVTIERERRRAAPVGAERGWRTKGQPF